jgi:hypothetical protein
MSDDSAGNLMRPMPVGEQGQQAEAKNLSGGKGVPKEDGDLKVVKTDFEGGKLIVVVESDNAERLMSTASRNLAYAQRFDYGLTNAGIEALAGMYVPEEEMEAAKEEQRNPTKWHRDFRLTPGI